MIRDSLRTRGVVIEAGFIPQPVKLSKTALIEFQAGVEQILNLTEIKKGEDYIQMSNKSGGYDTETRINLFKDKISVHILFPDQSLESLVSIFDEILKLVAQTIEIQIFVPIVVNIRKQISTHEKDSKLFFAEKLLNLTDAKQKTLNRPIQTIGLKLMLPPFISNSEGEESSTDGIELKIETLNEDSRDIYLEIHQIYSNPTPAQGFHTVSEFIKKTEKFLNENVTNFIGEV